MREGRRSRRVTPNLPVRILLEAMAKTYRLCDGVWEERGRNGAGTNSSRQPDRRIGSDLGRQARVEAEHQARIATEVGKTPH